MTPAGRIRVLPEETVNRVAAGEVVERPAAALKELLENSIDAGATTIAIELERSGKRLIRITDDGCGMGHDDLLLALERHATSKISAVEDLAHIASFGFRGEALPSIAAVSRMRIDTRTRGATEGTRLLAEGGRLVRVAPCACAAGTDIEVRDLFHTVPARLKFLRTDATELAHCLQVASRLALACPRLGLTLRHHGRELLRFAPAPDAGARLRAHLDRPFFAGLLAVRGADGELAVGGFISRPGAGRPGPEYQQLFVNARPVRDPLVAQAIREASRDHFRQESGGCSTYLWITLPPDAVDVNVHPTKREVRFRDPAAVRALVAAAVRETLRTDRSAGVPPASPIPPAPAEPQTGPGRLPAPDRDRAAEGAASPRYEPASPAQLPLGIPDTAPGPPAGSAPPQLFDSYLICPGPGGLVLVDQHAAHERVLYERFLARGAGASQQLLEPLLVELSPAEETAIENLRPPLEALGIAIEPFGPRTWRVRSLPPELAPAEAAGFIREMAGGALEEGAPPRVEEFRHRAAALLACHGAIRAGERLAPREIQSLLEQLARTENPGACPHGRPTTLTIDRAEIERRFKRT